MTEKGIAEKFTKILDDLERITDMGRKDEPSRKNIMIDDVMPAVRPELGAGVALDYFRMVRVLAWNEILGGSAKRLAYAAGEKIGRQLAIGSLDDLAGKIRGMGMATVEITPPLSIGDTQGMMTIAFRESAVSAGLHSFSEPVCSFEAGFLAGALEKLFRKKVTVAETRCMAIGDDHCQFEVRLGETRRKRKEMEEAIAHLDYSEYSKENVELLSTLAAHAVSTLENAFLYEQTKKMVITDPMTATFNFGYFKTRVKEEIQRSERQNQAFALAMIDVDAFKGLNDRFGHPGGDAVLKETARIMKGNVRGIDILCRYGGDEFVLILPQTNRDEAAVVCERIRAEIEHHDFGPAIGGEAAGVRITASFGCALFPGNSHYSDQLVEQADQALYEAKRSGRNQLRFFESPHPSPA
jgi:diguanylate cyclase (GGDEF)-like protein